MSREKLRVEILCEDRMQEQFLESLCKRRGWVVVRRHVAPRGTGAASAWVLERFPHLARPYHRPPPRRALLVAVDGDNQGPLRRRGQLDEKALTRGQSGSVQGAKAIGTLVPTWSIETWHLFFLTGAVVPEHEKSKDKLSSRFLAQQWGTLKSEAIREVLDGFENGEPPAALPSLADAQGEVRRLASPLV